MNDKYFKNRIENSPLGSSGLKLLNAQEKLISQEYEIEMLRIKAAKYKAFFFRESDLAIKLQEQEEENTDALIGEFYGFCWSSRRTFAVFRTLEDMYDEELLTEDEYKECRII